MDCFAAGSVKALEADVAQVTAMVSGRMRLPHAEGGEKAAWGGLS